MKLELSNLDDTRLAARSLALQMRSGDVYSLSGELGSGKTTFARYFLQALGVEEDVPSPTFTLAQTYTTSDSRTVWHFDLYRIETPEEAFELGIEDAFEEGVSLIEWPNRLGIYLPAERLELDFSFVQTEGARQLTIRPLSASWENRLDQLSLPGANA